MALIQATADAYQEPLDAITQAEVAAEGFPEISVEQFVAFYCKTFKATPATKVWVARFCLVQPYIGRNAGRATPPDQQTGAIEGIEREGEEGRG